MTTTRRASTRAANDPASTPQEVNGQSPADLFAAARRIARGTRQRRWLEQMLNPDTGLHPSDKERGIWYYQYINRIEALVEALRCAGFAVNHRALGPRGGRRWVLELSK